MLNTVLRQKLELFTLLIWWTSFSLANAISTVTLEQNGQYNGIIVAISPTVPETSRDVIIEGIKSMFRNGNSYLYKATKEWTTFGNVTILVPREWVGNYPYHVATHETWNDADIRVGPANPQYGNQPYTLQPGLCGERGSYIHFTSEFFTKANETLRKYGPPGRILVHEWSHYRYGVFDEYGYPGDAYYPAAYFDGNQLLPTVCSDVPLQGKFSDSCKSRSPLDPYCRFQPEVKQMNVRSSIMSVQFLPNVDRFCDKKTHNQFAPTKHNALCSRRSIWEVMKSHPDFSKERQYAVPFQEPTFHVVRPRDNRYVLLLDCSSDMNDFVNKNPSIAMQRINFVRSAAVNFIEENLPDGTWLSLISFGVTSKVLKPLQILNKTNRKGFTNAVPHVTCGREHRNVAHAMRVAMEQLNQRFHNRTDGTIITITNGVTGDASHFPQLRRDLKLRNIRAINIMYPPMPEISGLPSLAEATNGRNYMIAEIGAGEKGNSSTLAQLMGALEDVATIHSGNPQEDRVIIYERVHPTSQEDIKGTFTVDNSIGRDMKVTISYFKRENIFEVSLTNPRRKFGTDDYDNQYDRRTIAFNIKDIDAVIGPWSYALKVNKHDDQPVTVTVTAKPKSGFPITLRSWTNVGNSGINASATPLVIYAELFKGSRPIVNARVRAVIERPKINNTYSFAEVELLDNGSGAPDATRHDGIYARYFTQFVDPVGGFGFYSLTVYADDNDGRAQVVGEDHTWSSGVMPKEPDIPYCCGSAAPLTSPQPTGPFQRFSSAPAFLITASPKPGVDIFPPSTVRDLKVDKVDTITGYITLSWTAPGENYDFGQVADIEVHYFHNYRDVQNIKLTGVVLEPILKLPAGSHQTVRFFAPDGRNRHYFFALIAVDSSGLESGISNVVTCFVPPEPTTTSTTRMRGSPTTVAPSKEVRPLLTAELIGIIVGCTLAFLLFVAIIVAVICASRRRRKLQEEKMTHHKVSQVHGPDLVRPPSVASIKDAEWKASVKAEEAKMVDTNGIGPMDADSHGVGGGVYYTNSSLSPRQFVPASELLQHHDKRLHTFPTGPLHSNGNGNVQYYYEDEVDAVHRLPYSHYAPMEVVVDRASISSKPSSYGSQQTAEVTSSTGYGTHLRDNGYVNSSYEDGSDHSGETARLRPEVVPYVPLVGAPKRVLSESQV